METFVVDKSFYDIGSADDLKLWESDDLDPEVLRLQSSDMTEWSYLDRVMPGVVLHDRLMTDAALGTRPIKTEHSYSLASDGDSLPDSPIPHQKVDDMEDECFPAMSMNQACGRLSECVSIKDEPMSESDNSPHSSCPSSPQSIIINPADMSFETTSKNCIVKQPSNILISSPHTIIPQRIQLQHQKLNIKIEPGTAFHLPPTPPSCSSSDDSEDNATISQPSSPASRKISTARMMLNHHSTPRQPIHTPLISSQPKGSTGMLVLTEEEKRTLIAEGYPVPTRLPLTKAEEKSLKKIRRKIKNKISAQESRRKKKEYMDQLERKVEILVTENTDYKKKIDDLVDKNTTLMSQLQKLEAIVAKTHPQIIKQLKQ
ncbi:cyclic AMP response element-binding protein A isoform X2 [Aethina tumida]|uniref:cyclic AMP response element-binding protein A isoform X2 n=1 Tax=Aethina tumida TaxID=116153 RepID=UPI00214865B4|nr:cyclic AMP response element-binding protein A isoform X2 [Aethina tumida]